MFMYKYHNHKHIQYLHDYTTILFSFNFWYIYLSIYILYMGCVPTCNVPNQTQWEHMSVSWYWPYNLNVLFPLNIYLPNADYWLHICVIYNKIIPNKENILSSEFQNVYTYISIEVCCLLSFRHRQNYLIKWKPYRE